MIGSAQPPARAPPRMFAIIGVVAIIAIPLVAFVAIPNLNVLDEHHGLRSGDHSVYTVTGYLNNESIAGTLRLDFINVSDEGYTQIATPSGIAGWKSKTTVYTWDNLNRSGVGHKVGTERISTTWGLKAVDKYLDQDGSRNITTYLGNYSGFIYRQDISDEGTNLSRVLTETSIGVIHSGDVW